MTNSEGDAVVVIGAGIVGVCTAWHLLRRGADVTLIDRDEPGRGCSYGNAGALSFGSVAPLAMPGVMRDALTHAARSRPRPCASRCAYLPKAAPWLRRFVRASRPDEVRRIRRALVELARQFDRTACGDAAATSARRTSSAAPASSTSIPTRSGCGRIRCRGRCAASTAFAVERLGRADILALEPEVGPDYTVGMFTPGSGHVDQSLSAGHRNCGGLCPARRTHRSRSRGRDRGRGRSRASGARRECVLTPADHAVICAGAWSAQLLTELGYAHPAGEPARLSRHDPRRRGSRSRGRSSRRTERSFSRRWRTGCASPAPLNSADWRALRTASAPTIWCATWPACFRARKIPADWSFWMGHRPCLPNSLPVMGPSRHRGLWLSFGHGHLGLTMSAVQRRHSGARDPRRAVEYRPQAFSFALRCAVLRDGSLHGTCATAPRRCRPAARSCSSGRPPCR